MAEARWDPGRRRFLRPDAIVLLAVLGTVLAFVVNVSLRVRREDRTILCTRNLTQLYTSAVGFSMNSGKRLFPIGRGTAPRAHDSLNIFLGSGRQGLRSFDFVCPTSEASRAPLERNFSFQLTAETLSYAWTAAPLEITATGKPLASDKYYEGYEDGDGVHRGHDGGVNVLYTDGSVRWIEAEELPPATGLLPGLTR